MGNGLDVDRNAEGQLVNIYVNIEECGMEGETGTGKVQYQPSGEQGL